MKKTAIVLTTVAALGAMAMTAPAEARNGRNAAAIGAGIAAGAIAAGVGGYRPAYGYGYGPAYYGPGYGSYAYYGAPYRHHRRHWHHRRHR